MTEFKIPELGENVASGDVIRVLVNVGDSPTTLLPTEPLTFFDLFGNFNLVSRTTSNPAVTCVTNAGTVPGSNLLSDCFGNLLAGQGVLKQFQVLQWNDGRQVGPSAAPGSSPCPGVRRGEDIRLLSVQG